MSTRKIREALSETIETCDDYAEQCAHAGRLDEARSVRSRADRARVALAEVEAIEKAQATLRLVFEVGALNPYQTSDFSPEYALREWCGWTPNDDD